MIRIGIVGNIGCGKTFVASKFGYPVFNADAEVNKLYKSYNFNKKKEQPYIVGKLACSSNY